MWGLVKILPYVAGAAIGAAACGTIDPAVHLSLPDDDLVVGVSGGVIWNESEPIDYGEGLLGIDAGWVDGVFGLHGGLLVYGEDVLTRVGVLAEATVWYGLALGLGMRVGWAVGGAASGDAAVDLTFLVALPLPVAKSCDDGWSLIVAPYARPAFRLSGSDRDPDDLQGVYELGVTVRWATFGF